MRLTRAGAGLEGGREETLPSPHPEALPTTVLTQVIQQTSTAAAPGTRHGSELGQRLAVLSIRRRGRSGSRAPADRPVAQEPRRRPPVPPAGGAPQVSCPRSCPHLCLLGPRHIS